MQLDPLREARHLLFEVVPARDLKCHEGYLPRPAWGLERLLEPADVEHEDPFGSKLDRSTDRDGPDETTVEVVQPLDFDGREEPWDSARRENGRDDWTGREPLSSGAFDASGDALESEREVFEANGTERVVQQPAELFVRVEVSASTYECAELFDDRPSEDPVSGEIVPALRHQGDRL